MKCRFYALIRESPFHLFAIVDVAAGHNSVVVCKNVGEILPAHLALTLAA